MKKKINKFITTDLSDSIERSVESAVNADIDISELYEAVANEPVRVTPSNEVDENSLVDIAGNKNYGIFINDYQINFDKSTSVQEITDKLNIILEKMILKRPEQWIWSHNRWK